MNTIPRQTSNFGCAQSHPRCQQKRKFKLCALGFSRQKLYFLHRGNIDLLFLLLWEGGPQDHVRPVGGYRRAQESMRVGDILRGLILCQSVNKPLDGILR